MKALLVSLLASLLTACASMRLVDAQVQASSTGVAIESGMRYRFERLPSQINQPDRTEQVEALAHDALAQAGLVHDEAQARYSVLLGAGMQSYLADAWGRPLGQPGTSIHGSIMLGLGTGIGGMTGWGGMRFPPPTHYRHEISLLLRDLSSGQVVYETRATHEGPWADSTNILAALFEAALKDFPHPPTGIRRINVEIPR